MFGTIFTLLFLIHAGDAEFTYDKAYPDYAELKLSDVSHCVTFVNDQEKIQAGTMPLEEFLQNLISKEFHPVPPTIRLLTESGVELPIEVRNPSYNAIDDTLTFQVYLLTPFDQNLVENVTLFVDGNNLLL
ncbi:MAG: hypothetical protein S4CHLAM45_04990 [Chlamydiales bacterium]|nr:hypothetical protein [Chlamydiales bacterium]MCH9619960.1 hypothetical protein [Chlamydiales bacterium]MCH9622613.1 hypothetical protein [Chlamydiales bacterium]